MSDRLDIKIIADIVEKGANIIDMGCGNGDLLKYLIDCKKVKGTGVEINEKNIYNCVEKGLSVSHGDIDSGLDDYPDKLFDYVIFNQTIQQVNNPKKTIIEALRIGKKVIIGFPNFCYIKSRIQIFFYGHVPIINSLPYFWYNTPNSHFLSIKDFKLFCKKESISIQEERFLTNKKKIYLFPNLFALNAIFKIFK